MQAPLSGAQRKQELLGGHAKSKEAVCTPEARGLGVRHQQKPRLAVRVAGVIQKAVSRNMADLPTSLAGGVSPSICILGGCYSATRVSKHGAFSIIGHSRLH